MTNQNIPSNTSTNNHTASVQPFGHLPLIDDDELSRLSPDSPAVTQHPSNDLQPSQNTSIIISPVSSSTLPISNHSSHQNHPTLHLEINHQPVMNRNIHNLHSDGDDDHEHEDEEDDEDGYSSSLAPSSSIPRTSLVADDHEDRYCFGSSAESESSSVGLIDFQTERSRLILKKRKKATLIPTNSTSLNSSANSTSISNTLTESNSSNSNNNYTSSPELIPLPYAGDDVDHPMFSSSSRSQPQSQPHSSVLHHSAGLYWTQNGLESSSSLSSRSSSSALSIGLIAPLHHHHHHHHHIHSLPTINNSSNITSSSNNSIGNQPVSSPSQPRDYLAPTPTPSRPPSRSSSSDRKLGRSTHEPLEIHHHQTIPIDFNDSRDHSHQFYNS
ncbi:expressed protein [Phakopsora pachyrhizi]|uniref:Expressed protein n=1 Tax=Phakopsora pachyrhizi TaxID=170000 RepID=A0AAV0AQK5_PHAPC|nr:expressed protein [Phakopsora pachyrhizi]